MLCISQLCAGIAHVQKIPLKDVVIKMMIVKYLSIVSRIRMRAAAVIDGQYNRHLQIWFLGWWSIGLIRRSRICRLMLVWALNLNTEEVNHFLKKVDWVLTFLVIMSLLFYKVTHYINLDFVFILQRNARFIWIWFGSLCLDIC